MQPMENATPTSAYTHASSTQTASTVHAQSTQTKPIVYTQSTKRNRRGGACVPARTSAQRRFHTKNMRIVCGDFNDGCALVGRHGRAHRHRPYQSPLYIRVQSSPTTSTTQTKRVNTPPHNTSGAEMHRALPPPFFKTSFVCKLASR